MNEDPNLPQQQNPYANQMQAPAPVKKGRPILIWSLVGCGCCIIVIPFLSVIAIAILIQLGKNVNSVFSTINSQLQVASPNGE